MWKLWAKLFGWRYALFQHKGKNYSELFRVYGKGDSAYIKDRGYVVVIPKGIVYTPLNFNKEEL